MLPFAHTGITLGAAWLLKSGLTRGRVLSATRCDYTGQVNPSAPHRSGVSMDYRLVMVGAMLPDLVDKPIGVFLFRDTFSNGRIFCHTLLFLIVISLAGLYLYRGRGGIWLLILSFGTFTHLILDQMWLDPGTLLWPIYGFTFPKVDLSNWTLNMWHMLQTDPAIYVPELVGMIILAGFVAVLAHREKVLAFIRNGVAQ